MGNEDLTDFETLKNENEELKALLNIKSKEIDTKNSRIDILKFQNDKMEARI